MIEDEFRYYLENQADLLVQYDGKVIVLFNNNVEAVFETTSQAAQYVDKQNLTEKALIQIVSPGDEHYTTTLYTELVLA